MGKNTKTVLRAVDYFHCDDFARYLEDMAAKGWHFKEWGAGLKFEKGEPEEVTYAVEVFSGGSEYDTRPEPHTEEFAEYCKEAGWELVDAKMKFCIFKKIDENAVEILTDEERVENVCKVNKWNNILLMLLWGFNLFNQCTMNFGSSMSHRIFYMEAWLLMIMSAGLFLFEFGKFVYRTIWKLNAKKKIKAGEKIWVGDKKHGLRFENLFSYIISIFCLFMIGLTGDKSAMIFTFSLVGVMVLFAYLVGKFRPSSEWNMIIQVNLALTIFVSYMFYIISLLGKEEPVLTEKDVPLVIEDYRENGQEISKITQNIGQNWLGDSEISLIRYKGEDRNDALHYEIYRSEVKWIMDRIWKDATDFDSMQDVIDCREQWNAKEAFRTRDVNYYFARYEDTIVIFKDYYYEEELTQAQIDIICEKLDLR